MNGNKRFETGSMIQTYSIGESMDLECCKELIEKYGSSQEITLMITDNGKRMTYIGVVDLLNNLTSENELLKKEKEIWKNSWFEEMEHQKEHTRTILQLMEENEQLKEKLFQKLGKENELLKNELQTKN